VTTNRPPRIFYVAPAYLGPDAELGIPAVRNKVLGVCSALRAAGALPVVLASSPIGTRVEGGIISRHRGHGTIAYQLRSWGYAGTRRLVSMMVLAWGGARLIRRDDRVLFYNFFPEYLLLAAWRALLGRRCVIDIEDAPRPDEKGARGLMNRWAFRALRLLCADRHVVASRKLVEYVGLRNVLPIYGVSSWFQDSAIDSVARFKGAKVNVLLGGAIQMDTGLAVFVEALRLLDRDPARDHFRFFVTGHFQPDAEQMLEHLQSETDVELVLAKNLSNTAYSTLLSTIDVGLCLKLESNEVGKSTFPSKVIEIAARGLLLCSTPVSDVPSLFSSDEALILPSEEPEALLAALLAIDRDRAGCAAVAARGQRMILYSQSATRVGERLLRFLTVER
jgi:hypothetical protein